jgi:hypothetical protein
MKTDGSENQNRYATMRSKPSTWSGRLEQILLIQAGWKARKHPAVREVFFLTFPFIRRSSASLLVGRGFPLYYLVLFCVAPPEESDGRT